MQAANTGSSTHVNSHTAGRDAAAKAKTGLAGVKVAFAYASVAYDLDQMLKGIGEELPGVPVIGNTSFTGVIMPEGFVGGDDGFVGIMALADDELSVGVAALPLTDSARATGAAVARKALQAAGKSAAPDYFYMVASPGEEEDFLKGICDVIGRVPFFGGSAADNSISGDWKLYTNDGVFGTGVAVAFFYSAKPFANQFTGAYRETGDMGIVTKLDGKRKLLEIDGVPAVKKYAQWTGVEPDALKGMALLGATITSPLGVKDRLGDLVAIRHPMNGNDDYSMNVGNNLAVGTTVMRLEATVDELIDSTGEALRALRKKLHAPVAAYHLVHCGGRRAGIGDRIGEAAAQIRSEAGDVPFICEFTFGEYGYEDDGINTCGGLMLSFTAFGQ